MTVQAGCLDDAFSAQDLYLGGYKSLKTNEIFQTAQGKACAGSEQSPCTDYKYAPCIKFGQTPFPHSTHFLTQNKIDKWKNSFEHPRKFNLVMEELRSAALLAASPAAAQISRAQPWAGSTLSQSLCLLRCTASAHTAAGADVCSAFRQELRGARGGGNEPCGIQSKTVMIISPENRCWEI